VTQPTRKELAEKLITAAYAQLLAKIESGEASAADFQQAMNYARAAGVEILATPENPAGGLARALTDKLPFAGDSPFPTQ
jgi:hypothetical protein